MSIQLPMFTSYMYVMLSQLNLQHGCERYCFEFEHDSIISEFSLSLVFPASMNALDNMVDEPGIKLLT